jgi:DnaK suppressor protein
MNDTDKKSFEDALRIAIEKTKNRIDFYRDLSKPVAPDDAIGRVSRMDAINNGSINKAALEKSEKKLEKLKLALQNIDDPSFGSCVKCGQNIPLPRLLAVPESRFCTSCAV